MVVIPSRRWWLAGPMSLVTPGLGQWYCDRKARAAVFLGGHLLLTASTLFLIVTLPPQFAPLNVAMPVLFLLGWQVVGMVDAIACARRTPSSARLGVWTRWYACVVLFVLMNILVLPFWAKYAVGPWIRTFKIPTGGMEPTVLRGDWLLAVNWAYNPREPFFGHLLTAPRPPARGDIVTFPFPEDPTRTFMKRVIGLPGETVEVRGRTVYIDGEALVEPYVQFIAPDDVQRSDWGPETIPTRSVFVLGDNRDNSRDSRFWGYVKREDVLGRAVVIYWSRDSETGGVRFDRIGRRLR
jgi:signal peptidase I